MNSTDDLKTGKRANVKSRERAFEYATNSVLIMTLVVFAMLCFWAAHTTAWMGACVLVSITLFILAALRFFLVAANNVITTRGTLESKKEGSERR